MFVQEGLPYGCACNLEHQLVIVRRDEERWGESKFEIQISTRRNHPIMTRQYDAPDDIYAAGQLDREWIDRDFVLATRCVGRHEFAQDRGAGGYALADLIAQAIFACPTSCASGVARALGALAYEIKINLNGTNLARILGDDLARCFHDGIDYAAHNRRGMREARPTRETFDLPRIPRITLWDDGLLNVDQTVVAYGRISQPTKEQKTAKELFDKAFPHLANSKIIVLRSK